MYVNNFDMPYGLKCLCLIYFILHLFVLLLFIFFSLLKFVPFNCV